MEFAGSIEHVSITRSIFKQAGSKAALLPDLQEDLMKKILLPVIAASLVFGASHKAWADYTLYGNGPIDGNTAAWQINAGNAVGDSFTLTSNSTITGVNFWAWNAPGETVTQIDWSISSAPLDTTGYANGTSSVNSTYNFTNGYGYDINQDSFSIGSVNLLAGTYYLNLQNAVATNGDPAYWDQNNGPSTASDTLDGVVPSESFQVQGTVDSLAAPEPNGLVMMVVGSLIMGIYLLRRRRAPARIRHQK